MAVVAVVVPVGLAPSATALQPVAQPDLVSDNAAEFTPNVLDGRVEAIAKSGNTVVIAGEFTQVQEAGSATTLTRNNILAFDATTGAVSSSFVPTVDGEVTGLALSPDGQSVYLGGLFNTVNGVALTGLAKVSLATGANVTQFKPPLLNALVQDIRINGNALYVGGVFTTAKKAGVTYPRGGFVAVDATNGAVQASPAVQFAGYNQAGVSQVYKMDVSPDRTKLVVIGNFATADGQDRDSLAMIDLTTGQLAPWQTNRLKPHCGGFQFYVRDVEFSPDGSYFVLGNTGSYGAGPPTLCDTVTRWETNLTGSDLQPTWVDYTGGDTTYAVGVTGGVVYVGGHMRWYNNPFARDASGQGAVAREGIAALDPVNGLPLDWNPGRVRGSGVFDFLDTPDGLWVASDTDRISNYEYHGRIAFFPLAGGKKMPANKLGSLPSSIYQLGPGASNVMYRVNAGGAALQALDNGPDWASDTTSSPSPLHNAGSTATTYGSLVANVDASVPATTPAAVFSSERADPTSPPEMLWRFPVPAGAPVQVRLYFANRSSLTRLPGQRVFDVTIDGATKLNRYDIVADVGDQRGVMKSFDVTSDGSVDVQFLHRTNNPLVNAIEIVRTDVAQGPSDSVRSRAYDGTTVGPVRSLANAGVNWATARASTMVDGTLYTAWNDGSLTARSFDGATLGAPTNVDAADQVVTMSTWHSEVAKVTSLFYSGGRLYYTQFGSSSLLYRYFSTESGVVGAQEFTANGALPDINWTTLQGAFVTGSNLYYVTRADGVLRRADFVNGAVVPNTSVAVSGSGIDGVDWRASSIFLSTFGSVDAKPVARFTSSCTGGDCSFDASGSTDDGSITGYSWSFGDGGSATGANATHHYTKGGSYNVTLTVTDDAGQTGTATSSVLADIPNVLPNASFTGGCAQLTCSFDASASNDPDGTITGYAWAFGDGTTGTGVSPTHAYAAAGTYDVTLTVTDDSGGTRSQTGSVTATAPTVNVSFVGKASSNANAATNAVTTPAQVQADDTMLLFETDNGTGVTVTPPSGWTLLSTASTGATSRVWRRTATAGDANQTLTVGFSAIVKSAVQLVVYRGTSGAVPVVARGTDATAVTAHSSPTATVTQGGTWAVTYWADKSSTTTAWTAPAGLSPRDVSLGSGSGRITALVADSGQAVPGGPYGGLTASTDAASRALMFTVLLAPGS